MKDKQMSLNALRKEVERNFDMQNLYLPVHILDVAEDVEEGIVRCKDCEKAIQMKSEPGIVCTNHMISYFHKPDDYCSDGVRKNDDMS